MSAGLRLSRRFAIAAAVLTPVLALPLLVTTEYRVERCAREYGMYGCGSEIVPFGPQAAPALLVPVLIIGALVVLATAAARSEADIVSLSAALAVFLAGAPLLGHFWQLIGPVLLLVAAALVASGLRPRYVAIDLVLAAGLTLAAFGAVYVVVVGLLLGGVWLPGGASSGAWIYVAFATALGVAIGILDAARDPRWPLARGLCCAYAGTGVGVLVAVALVIRPLLYPEGAYVNLGIGSAYTTAASVGASGVAAGAIALRVLLQRPWEIALLGSWAAAVAFVLFVAATLLFAGPFSPQFTLEPPLPPRHLLPSSSTAD